MFVVFAVYLNERESPKFKRLKEFKTLEEANEYMDEQEVTEKVSYTIVIE